MQMPLAHLTAHLSTGNWTDLWLQSFWKTLYVDVTQGETRVLSTRVCFRDKHLARDETPHTLWLYIPATETYTTFLLEGGPAQNCCKYSAPAVSIKRTAAPSAASLLKSTSCPFQNLCLPALGNPGIDISSSPNRNTLSEDENLQTQLKSLGIKKQTSNQPTNKCNQTKTNTNPTKQNKQNKPSKNKNVYSETG